MKMNKLNSTFWSRNFSWFYSNPSDKEQRNEFDNQNIDRNESQERPMHEMNVNLNVKNGSYKAKLFDPRWHSKRQEILKRDNFKCWVCKSTLDLQVHHKQYHFSRRYKKFKDPWEYNNRYLITLCVRCHQRGHSKFEVPVKKI